MCKGASQPLDVKCSVSGKCPLKLIVTSTCTVPQHVSASELNISEMQIRSFWVHIKTEKTMSESNICFLKPEILCSLILMQSSLTNISYPARDQGLLGSKTWLNILYACQQQKSQIKTTCHKCTWPKISNLWGYWMTEAGVQKMP